MKFIFFTLAVVIVLAASIALVGSKKEVPSHKEKSASVRFNAKDFPEHGVSLIVPSDPSFGKLLSQVRSVSGDDPYLVFLNNTSSRAVVGYSIKWECFDGKVEDANRSLANDRNVSHIVAWIFLKGEESARSAAIKASEEIIKPHSTWLISSDSPARPVEEERGRVAAVITRLDESDVAETLKGCASVTVIADGIFFDDGRFIGPDTSGFFTEVKSQMEARYEILRGVQNELESGKRTDEIFKGLERIRDQEGAKLGELPTADEFRSYFRNLFAKDLLGQKEVWGADKAIENVQMQLSKPWVNLRKLD